MRTVTKRKRPPRMITCPECRGEREAVATVCTWPDGHTTPGIESRHIACETCGSTGKVKSRMVRACCCSGPKHRRCDGCANAGRDGAEIHHCSVRTEDEIAFETEIEFMPMPHTGKTPMRLHEMDVSRGPRAPR